MKNLSCSALFSAVPTLLRGLFDSCEFAWQVIPRLGEVVDTMVQNPPEGFTSYCPGVIIGAEVTISPSATILPPAVICSGTEIRPGAFIRGKVFVGTGCVIGNSTELKNCVLMDGVQVPHYNYVGDSVLGNHVHLGAGAICSNLKSDKSAVVIRSDVSCPTGQRKLGAILGDYAEIGCGCVLNPGTVIGRNTTSYPLVSLRGVYPPSSIIKSSSVVVEKFSN